MVEYSLNARLEKARREVLKDFFLVAKPISIGTTARVGDIHTANVVFGFKDQKQLNEFAHFIIKYIDKSVDSQE